MLHPIKFETAYTFAEVVEIGRQIKNDDFYEDDDCYGTPYFAERIANASWARNMLEISESRHLEEIFKKATFTLDRNSFNEEPQDSIFLVSPGVRNKLREQVKQFDAWCREQDGDPFSDFPRKLFQQLFDEGVLDWMIRSKRSNYELRGCIWCGRWFEPVIVRRGRFCSPSCRKRFNNARISADPSVRMFRCVDCQENRPLEEFSGLIKVSFGAECLIRPFDATGAYPNPYLCIRHVLENAPKWKRYVEPFVTESLKENV
jgi:hypothetical protein